jgi:hypothetical protein
MRLVLPSGVHAELSDTAPLVSPPAGIFAEALAEVRARFTRDRAELSLGDLPLSDLHTLRAILQKLGKIPDPEISLQCRNCDRKFRVVPSASFELGPYRDAELTDPVLDAAFEFGAQHALEADDARFATLELCNLSVSEAEPLFEALSGRFRVSSKLVAAMGIVSLGGERSRPRIARRLRAAPDDVFDRVAAVFEAAHYPPRLTVPHPCPECGMVEWVPVPAERELTLAAMDGERQARAEQDEFWDLDRFEAEVTASAERVYRQYGLQGVGLSVLEGPAECDDAGEPLLGCYLPPAPDALIPTGAEVRIFYRTFAAIWQEEGAYDVAAEIEETLRHELEHHLGHLAGSDPLDDHERAELELEAARRIGRSETRRRAARAFGDDLSDFFRRTWPLWLIAAAATLLAVVAR